MKRHKKGFKWVCHSVLILHPKAPLGRLLGTRRVRLSVIGVGAGPGHGKGGNNGDDDDTGNTTGSQGQPADTNITADTTLRNP